ncbi:MAG TPA: hypothetical protein VH796_02920, partial [Nitrososphaeraceae archaeon]
VLTKFDGAIDSIELVKNIAKDLTISNPIVISSKTGYGIHKLKTMINAHVSSEELARERQSVNTVSTNGKQLTIL